VSLVQCAEVCYNNYTYVLFTYIFRSGRVDMPEHNSDILIPADAARKLIESRDSRAAMLWLRLQYGGMADGKTIAAELGWSAAEFRAAAAQLESLGLLPQRPLEPADELPSYGSADISTALESDPAFAETLRYTQTRLGRNLLTADISRLLGIYQNVGLPAGALMLLVSFCDNRAKRRSGKTARVTLRMIEQEAYRWARDGITTESEAEEHVRKLEEAEDRAHRIAGILQIHGRALTRTERAYLEHWATLPLNDEAIYAAYDRTVVNTGALKWSYMNKILEDWAANGVPQDLSAPARKPSAPARPAQPQKTTIPARAAGEERLRRLRELEEGKQK